MWEEGAELLLDAGRAGGECCGCEGVSGGWDEGLVWGERGSAGGDHSMQT